MNDNLNAFNTDEADSTLCLKASDDDIGTRADVFISKEGTLTRSAASSLLEKGEVFVIGIDGIEKPVKKNYRICKGDTLYVTLPEAVPCEAQPEDIPLDIVFEDDDVIVINKPQGMVVHPAPGHTDGTLVSALLWHCKDSLSDINGVIRPGIIHRIDKDTSGLIAVAKNNDAHLFLASQLEDHTLSRIYYAIVLGNISEAGTVDAPIARHKTDRKKMAIAKEGGKRAVTHYEPMEPLNGYTLMKMKLETGRTHQIRVHLSHIGHPILGDEVYSHPSQFEKRHPKLLCGQALHAGELTFIHPRTKKAVTVSCPPPDNFNRALELLRGNG